jgi:hypothetical protein
VTVTGSSLRQKTYRRLALTLTSFVEPRNGIPSRDNVEKADGWEVDIIDGYFGQIIPPALGLSSNEERTARHSGSSQSKMFGMEELDHQILFHLREN